MWQHPLLPTCNCLPLCGQPNVSWRYRRESTEPADGHQRNLPSTVGGVDLAAVRRGTNSAVIGTVLLWVLLSVVAIAVLGRFNVRIAHNLRRLANTMDPISSGRFDQSDTLLPMPTPWHFIEQIRKFGSPGKGLSER